MGYISVDIGRVTVTCQEEARNRLFELFGGTLGEAKTSEGWISSENPSSSPIGFAAIFEGEEVYADFHNLPFYYKSRENYAEYHNRIVSHVSRHPLFEGWRGHAHRFKPAHLPLLVQLLNELVGEEFVDPLFLALARVDFEDDFYRLQRVIDGDTLVVAPPLALRPWLLDIHVRLYGLETPELGEPLGPQYKRHLEDLCGIDGQGELRIVWERESLNTGYPGFPRTSFERAIGHIFIADRGGRFLYVNGLMLLLRHASSHRKGKSLLRGSSRLQILDFSIPWSASCATRLALHNGYSYTMKYLGSLRPPMCLVSYRALPRLDPRDPAFEIHVLESLEEGWTFGCPFEERLRLQAMRIGMLVRRLEVSPFDLPLSYINLWSREMSEFA